MSLEQQHAARLDAARLASMIDHTLLKAHAAKEDIVRLCAEAREHGFATVCVNPFWVKLAAAELRGTAVGVATVIGFPLGATTTAAKVAEARQALADGAAELDMVIHIGALKAGDAETVRQDIEQVVLACEGRARVKVILETCYLTDEEKAEACRISKAAGADYVKTSTGFGSGGATEADVRLMRQAVGPQMGVKASGGIKDKERALRMIAAGASRLGTSSGVAIAGTGGKTTTGL